MITENVAILGCTGMLGSACVSEIPNAVAFNRSNLEITSDVLKFPDWVINCIGAIPQRVSSEKEMFEVNANFPRKIELNRVIQITTDCVFDGSTGNYSEHADKDAKDSYGLSKIEGEKAKSLKIRCSIIGPDKSNASLFEWFRQQPPGASIDGFTNHLWNGVSTQVFAKLANGLIKSNFWENATYHFVPKDSVSKYELLNLFKEKLGRNDIKINSAEAKKAVNRTLRTIYPDKNEMFWYLAGYNEIPSIAQIVNDLKIDP